MHIFSPNGRSLSHEPQYALLDTRISSLQTRIGSHAERTVSVVRLILGAKAKLEGQSWDVQRIRLRTKGLTIFQ
jgi:hypothetical protein